MKKLILFFAALCCMAMMHAEVVFQEKCDPTDITVGYTQDCWEDLETGKLYAEEECLTELNPAKVVIYNKLNYHPMWDNSGSFDMVESANYGGVQFNWSLTREYEAADGKNYATNIKVPELLGSDILNARLKWYWETSDHPEHANFTIDILVNNVSVCHIVPWTAGGVHLSDFQQLVSTPLHGLKTGDIIHISIKKQYNLPEGGRNWATALFAFSLEYTPTNPSAIGVFADNKRKFKGTNDPELTYHTSYPIAQELKGVTVSREAGEDLGTYPIHVTVSERDNPEYDLSISDGQLEIVDGIHHSQGEIDPNGFAYKQDYWEETATGKYYEDAYLEHEVKPKFIYPKLKENPVVANDGFTIKESETYNDVTFDWVAETTYDSDHSEKRSVEFLVKDTNIANQQLAWYMEWRGGPSISMKTYVNDILVDSMIKHYHNWWDISSLSLPALKKGDVVRVEVEKPRAEEEDDEEEDNNSATIAVCLQYVTPPQNLRFTAEEAGSTVELKRNGATEPVKIQYSTDHSNWTTVDFNEATTTGTITLANVGDNVWFRKAGNGVASGFSNVDHQYSFAMTGKIAASGNVMSLIDNTCEATTIPNTYCFAKLFEGCTSLTQAPKLPATTLKGTCYWCMFLGCTNLTTPPVLPATTLAASCYTCMFKGCTKLATAPVLPATTLKEWCYNGMFENCTSLTTAPELPVTTLAEACYVGMFKGCTSLASAPELPATTMATQCYSGMFSGCTKLVSAPTLASASLAPTCYRGMFEGCTSLTAAPALPATELKASCYENMFSGCTKLKSAPTLAAMKMVDYCYSNMFKGCTSLTTAPELPATTISFYCYKGMFSGCTKLESAPELPAMNMLAECYEEMFKDCTSLTTAPELPATTLVRYCYKGMFDGCSKLNYVKVAFTDWSYYKPENWLNGVAPTGTFVCPEGLELKYGASYIPEGWTVNGYTVTATQDPNDAQYYYATFYSSASAYTVPQGVTAYTGVVDGNLLRMAPVEGNVIPKGEAVVLRATAGQDNSGMLRDIEGNQIQIVLNVADAAAPLGVSNDLTGTDEAIESAPANSFFLLPAASGVGYYPCNGDGIDAHSAFLQFDTPVDIEAFLLKFDQDTPTGIDDLKRGNQGDGMKYDIMGRPVGDDYRGIVIMNGKKFVKK
ncbi:MAG: leucine-rich repeat protein [Bacteroidales bacterium]|nr:leucine-rich repeat protein [Candidatus Sodaliphilus aphodohippi]